ncbi:NADP-dependent glyceraldehyde-3-phosphate dehydrogenase [Hymenobacter sp. BT664]|uniref:NADP-dependent glyceraldehyde-3-phosphate dehydrogenase n=1 Tax=Hymenobacter montanus TaxID=2771359 RepID=A0A927BGZ0_9BACT|nr:NADP-dependent glyceraldehyde-3-phosphate dehydrogenase [Hymenobacter montanus]MBD2770266.1 NADP-dependent glyceraldehyde-3-phosphate dehydrogenase [Hymenobacter montanus]
MPITTTSLTELFPPDEAAIPAAWRRPEPLHQREYLLDGELRQWAGPTQEVLSPIQLRQPDGSLLPIVIGSYPLLDEAESLRALEAAVRAYDHGRGEWPTRSVGERIAAVEHFTRLIVARKKEIVQLLLWEIGKSAADSEKEFDRTIDYIRNTIDALKEMDRDSSRFIIEEGIIGQIRRSPLGVVLCMGPFNYPLNETFCMLIPALIMGNAVLFKPPKHGTLLHYPLLQAFTEAFPKGVVNTVYGRGNTIVPALMASGKINVLGLIGSSRVADSLKKLHPKSNRLRAILGLDAKNVAIVLPDADLEVAVKESLLGALSFNGQRCTALKLFFVHEAIAEEFVQQLGAEINQLRPGMPWDEQVNITPLPEPQKPGYLAECLADAQAQGARIVNEGGGTAAGPLVYPALVYPVRAGMKLWREEQFGPVVPVASFAHVDEAIQYIIDSDHGQQVSIFGRDSCEVAHLVDQLVNQVSRVNINAQCQRGPDTFPFTGRKDSAEGTLSVHDALRSFSIRTVVATKQTEANKRILNEIVNEQASSFLSTRFIL